MKLRAIIFYCMLILSLFILISFVVLSSDMYNDKNLPFNKSDALSNDLEIYTDGMTVEYHLWSESSSEYAYINPGGSTILKIPHSEPFILPIARPVSSKLGLLFGYENDDTVVASTLPRDSTAALYDSTADVLLDIPGFGGIRDTGNPSNDQQLEIYSNGMTVEYNLWSRSSFEYDYMSPGGSTILTIPHVRVFVMSIARPCGNEFGLLFGYENDEKVVASTLTLDSTANFYDNTVDVLLDIPGFGGIRDTGNPSDYRKLEIYSNGQTVEYNLWSENGYYQGEVTAGDSTILTIPHVRVFVMSIACPDSNEFGLLFGYENDGTVVASILPIDSTAVLYDEIVDVLLDIPGFGGIRDKVYSIDIDQSIQDRGFPIRHALDGDWGAAQSYEPTYNTVSYGEVYLRKFGTPEFNLTIELRENHPQGTLLDTLTFTPEETPTNWDWMRLNFEDISIDSETDYFIVMPPAPSGVTTSFGYEWGYAFGNQYDDGSFWFTRDGGSLWRDLPTMYEFCFRTYGYD